MVKHKWDNGPLEVGECTCGEHLCKPADGDKVTPIGYCRQMTKEERVMFYSYDNVICKAEDEIRHFGIKPERIALLEGLRLLRDELREKIESSCK